jgi:hypothetical protein
MSMKSKNKNRFISLFLVMAGLVLLWAPPAVLAQEGPGEDESTIEVGEEGETEEGTAEETGEEEAGEEVIVEEETVPPSEEEGEKEELVTVEAELAPFPDEEAGEAAPAAGKPKAGADTGMVQLDAQSPTTPPPERFYQINGILELHTNLVSDDYSANDVYMVYYLKGNFDVTKNNRLSLRFDLTQRFIADNEESGFWFGDIRLYYTRKFKIMTWNDYVIPGMVYGYLTAPTSRPSIERGIITKPTLVFALAPSIGPVTFIGRAYMQYIFARYSASKMGDPNNQFLVGYDLQLLYQTPLDWLVLSGDWSYTWFKKYQTREHEQQMWFAEYYWEAAVTFVIPMPRKAPSMDITLAYAQGANVLEEGVYRTYFVKRDQSEMYLSINLVY